MVGGATPLSVEYPRGSGYVGQTSKDHPWKSQEEALTAASGKML